MLEEYVNGVGLKKDMQDLSNHLQHELSRSVLQPAGWSDLQAEKGCLYSTPKSKPKWRAVKGAFIKVEIYLAWPVQDDCESYVNLYVPPKWKKRSEFRGKLKAPIGFQHVKDSDVELADETSVFKDVPYESYVGADGLFDFAAFIDAFQEATKAIVNMEKSIDKILEGMA
jgi:hypothetical protein